MIKIFLRGISLYIDGFFIGLLTVINFIAFHFLVDDLIYQLDNFKSLNLFPFYIFSFLTYFITLEYYWKSTFGKKIFKFKIQDSGSNNYFLRILVRTILKLIPFNQISFLFNDKHMFWHEKLTYTQVIRNNSSSRSTE